MGHLVRAYLINLSSSYWVSIISDSHIPNSLSMKIHFKEMEFLL